jgi:16S rRNA processing protein RimM
VVAADRPEGARRLEIGRIGSPHGLAGEMRVTLHFSGSEALESARTVFVVTSDGARELGVEGARPHGRAVLLRLAGVNDRDAAEALRGARLEMARSALPPLAEGEYYLVDLIGATVTGPDGPVGEVTGIAAHPSIASVEVRLRDGRQAEQLLSAPWVARVDAEARVIELANLDGLVL